MNLKQEIAKLKKRVMPADRQAYFFKVYEDESEEDRMDFREQCRGSHRNIVLIEFNLGASEG